MQRQQDGNERSTPPALDEIEVSLFGPGYGECALVHLGDGQWFVVDSCVASDLKTPACLEYLREIGVDPAKHVAQIIATHWHDDHVRGLSALVRSCRSAEFVCSDALREKEFLTLICAYTAGASYTGSGVDEFASILKELIRDPTASRGPKFAIADLCLWKDKIHVSDEQADSELHALSPSHYSCIISKTSLARRLPQVGPMKRVVDIKPNDAAVVLWARVGDISILLGSDLQKTGHPQSGWSCIMDSKTRPGGRASVFKIPHHGSENADHPDVWKKMLGPNAISILSPWRKGDRSLPTREDVRRICLRTSEAYATGVPKTARPLRRPPAVERTIREATKNMRRVCVCPGHVRVRLQIGRPANDARVELFNEALKLTSS